MIEFKDKLKSSRIAKKLTQEELATQLNVTRQAVSKWEQGRGIPDVASLKNIARILDISIDDLLSNEETKIMVLGKSSEVKKSKRLTVISIIVCLGLCTATILASIIINNTGALTNQTLTDYKAKILTLTPDISVESYGETYTLKITDETEFLGESGYRVDKDTINIGDYVTVSYLGSNPISNIKKIQVFDTAVYTELDGWFMNFGGSATPNETYSGDGYFSIVHHDEAGFAFGRDTYSGSFRSISNGNFEDGQNIYNRSIEVTLYVDLNKIQHDVYLLAITPHSLENWGVVVSELWLDWSYGRPGNPITLTGKRKFFEPQEGDYSPMSYNVTYLINLEYMDSLEAAIIYEYDASDTIIGTIPVSSVADIAGITVDALTNYVIVEQKYKTGAEEYTERTAVDRDDTFDFRFSDACGVIGAHYWHFI